MIGWCTKIISVAGGVLTETDSPLLLRCFHKLQCLQVSRPRSLQTGVRMLPAESTMPVMLCFSMQHCDYRHFRYSLAEAQ